jgi:Phage lysozyme
VQVPLNQNQFDALVAFGFNAGCPEFQKSELVRGLNEGEYKKVPDQLKRFVHGNGGEVIKGLVRRRGDDARLFDGQSVSTPPPSLATCAQDNLGSPPTAGCYRVKIRILPNYYPGDEDEGLGVEVRRRLRADRHVQQHGGRRLLHPRGCDADAERLTARGLRDVSRRRGARSGDRSPKSGHLPCSMLVRVDGEVVVQANDEGQGATPTFSSNCPARADAPDYCDIALTSDQTVTATFG